MFIHEPEEGCLDSMRVKAAILMLQMFLVNPLERYRFLAVGGIKAERCK